MQLPSRAAPVLFPVLAAAAATTTPNDGAHLRFANGKTGTHRFAVAAGAKRPHIPLIPLDRGSHCAQ